VNVLVHLVMLRDHVYRAAHRVVSIEQRGRSAHHFHPLQIADIERLAVIAGLRRESAGRNPVLHYEHAVPIETADHGAAGARPETAFRHPGPVFERLSKRCGSARLQVQRRNAVHGAE
jgi:hypothetical protein